MNDGVILYGYRAVLVLVDEDGKEFEVRDGLRMIACNTIERHTVAVDINRTVDAVESRNRQNQAGRRPIY